jgi:3-oxoacyl-[acyl-carrier protein] reductase
LEAIRGTFVVSKQAARRVRSGGAIVNFSTSVTKLQFPTYGAYAASKGAVEAMTLVLARELRGKDITVNAVAPGPTATELFLGGKDQATIENLAKAAPLERLGIPADIAAAVAFLAGPARWINGQVIYVNGGLASSKTRHCLTIGWRRRRQCDVDRCVEVAVQTSQCRSSWFT